MHTNKLLQAHTHIYSCVCGDDDDDRRRLHDIENIAVCRRYNYNILLA